MEQQQFEALVERIRKETTELLVTKGREYAGDADRLANFKRGAALTGVDPLTVLFIYMSKHYDALATYIRDNQAGGKPCALSEPITGRISDLINYCVLARALIEEKEEAAQEPLKEFAFTSEGALPTPSNVLRVILRDDSKQVTTLAYSDSDEFLLQVNRRLPGSHVVFGGRLITAWKYEGEPNWRTL